MTAPRYPEGVAGADLLPRVKAAGAILAGGLHPQIKDEYFRIGHMGPTNMGDLLATVGAVETGLVQAGYKDFEPGAGVAAVMAG
jgi:alanine-glyoxylate transaminase/serine-glyoxylate transaminase/serine-pyruvate transaminase